VPGSFIKTFAGRYLKTIAASPDPHGRSARGITGSEGRRLEPDP
jgi:hypothetical protein